MACDFLSHGEKAPASLVRDGQGFIFSSRRLPDLSLRRLTTTLGMPNAQTGYQTLRHATEATRRMLRPIA